MNHAAPLVAELAVQILAPWCALGPPDPIAALDVLLAGERGDFEAERFAAWCSAHNAPIAPASLVGWAGDAARAATMGDVFAYRAAVGFLVFLLEARTGQKAPRFAALRSWFTLAAVTLWGSPSTRAAVAAWLADPWFAEAEALLDGATLADVARALAEARTGARVDDREVAAEAATRRGLPTAPPFDAPAPYFGALDFLDRAKLAELAESFPCLGHHFTLSPVKRGLDDVIRLDCYNPDTVHGRAFAEQRGAEGRPMAEGERADGVLVLAFLAWLVVAATGLQEPRFVARAADFTPARLVRWGSPETRAIFAAWLAAPWFPAPVRPGFGTLPPDR